MNREAASPRSRLRRGFLHLAGRGLAGLSARPPGVARVLVLQPDHLGDILLAAPALALLRAGLPRSSFTYLVGPWSADAARHGPLSDDVRTIAFPGFTRSPQRNLLHPYLTLRRVAQRLRTERFDAAVIVRHDHWWGALLAAAAGIPVRIGFSTADTLPLLSHSVPLDPTQHVAGRVMSLVGAVVGWLGGKLPTTAPGDPAFRPRDADHLAAERILVGTGTGGQPRALVHPGAGMPLKSWPAERWGALADGLAARGVAVVLSGGPGEDELLRQVQRQMAAPPAALVQHQPLGTLAAVLHRCHVAIGPDNGPLHLAAAVGIPTVRLYGPAAASVYGPWPPAADQQVLQAEELACTPCGHLTNPPCGASSLPPCMWAIQLGSVLAAAERALFPRGAEGSGAGAGPLVQCGS